MQKIRTAIITVTILFIAVLVEVTPACCSDAKGGWEDVGVRMGFQAGPKNEYFHQYEVAARYGMPFDWRNGSGWGVAPKLYVAAGVLDGGGTGFIGSVGPSLLFGKKGAGVKAELGISAHLLNKCRYGRQNFGSLLQFGAFIGLIYRFHGGIGLEYRLQHISNGHIFYPEKTPNPGLDLHMIGVSWLF